MVYLPAYELRAACTVLHDVPEVPGEVMRFARKAMGLRQDELGKLLGLDRATVSRMETGGAVVNRQTQLAMLALVKVALGSPGGIEELQHAAPVAKGAELQMRVAC